LRLGNGSTRSMDWARTAPDRAASRPRGRSVRERRMERSGEETTGQWYERRPERRGRAQGATETASREPERGRSGPSAVPLPPARRRMEIPSIQGLQIETALRPLATRQAVGERAQRLRIGVPNEAPNQERRVALAPYAAGLLVAGGHEVVIETGAGNLAHFSDAEYAEAGAQIAPSAADLYAGVDLVAKVFPPRPDELELMQEKQVLISAL